MKVLVVAKTRRGAGACVGGITEKGRSVRLIAADASTNEHAGLQYEVGQVWEIDWQPDPTTTPPHTENIIVRASSCLRVSSRTVETIHRFMPPVKGGPGLLFEGLAHATAAGSLYVAASTGLPKHSTMFWQPDRPLQLDSTGKRIRYRYTANDNGCTLTFVGFQEPIPEIPAGTLLRVSLAHPWRPSDHPDDELRCFLQLSGWFSGEAPCSACTSGTPTSPHPTHKSTGSHASFPQSPQVMEVLKNTFGFSSFLPLQAGIIDRVLRRQDTLAVLPTGGGKSLCYQLPALLFEGLTVVVSPLIALMHDQVRLLRALDVPAACLNHMVPLSDWTKITGSIRKGATRILYVAPETLLRPEILLLLEQSELACIAVDEAHCISEWGHDFRKEYRQLRNVRDRFPNAVCLMLTATATERVRKDIRTLMQIPENGEFVASFNRPNLFLSVQPRLDKLKQVLTFLRKHKDQSGIIYCGTRKQADDLCADLNANGCPALPYHAGLRDEVRRQNQESFVNDQTMLMVATIAFGMGINKSNVRFVVHAHMPKDLESYYQEIGRAGRDGLRADCLLLYSRADLMVHRHFIETGAESERAGRQARLNQMVRFAETRECRRAPLLGYFGETLKDPCGNCDNCAGKQDTGIRADATKHATQFLACAHATGQVFGPAHLIAVLRGSKSARVLAHHHDRLQTFAAGKELSAQKWRELAQEFLHLGLVEQDMEVGSLRITSKGREVLRGAATVHVPVEPMPDAASATGLPAEHDPDLFQLLRSLRKELAEAEGLPAYMVFSDRALTEMATLKPSNEEAFMRVTGVGAVKLGRYGRAFLDLIAGHCGAAIDKSKTASATLEGPDPVRPSQRRRQDEIARLFQSGESLVNIARRYDIKDRTAVKHLTEFVELGGRLNPEQVLALSGLSEAEREPVLDAFKKLGTQRLGPVHQALSGSVSYEELWRLRLYVLAAEKNGALNQK